MSGNSLDLFHVIDDGVAVLRSKGRYRQTKVYRRGEHVFAGLGGVFIRLTAGDGTSDPNTSWIGLEGPGIETAMGRAPKFVGGGR
jgi:hypothetical protein